MEMTERERLIGLIECATSEWDEYIDSCRDVGIKPDYGDMKSVLISIQPKWCELIASGKKTVEVRKTRPKMKTPFKCYIYCTKGRGETLWCYGGQYWYDTQFPKERPNRADGKVIGEFVCDAVEHYTSNCTVFESVLFPSPSELEEMCLTLDEFNGYGTRGKLLYGWHISDLVIYDKPKELNEFYRWTDYDDSKNDKRPCSYCEHNAFDYSENCEYCSIDYDGEHCIHLQMKRPPQSWCYVDQQAEKGR